MSVTRADIAAALDAVEGVRGNVYPPRTPTDGDSWIVWESSEVLTMCNLETTWSVYVILGNADLESTMRESDPLIEPVTWALAELGAVTLVEPYRITLDGQTGNAVPAIHVTFTTV